MSDQQLLRLQQLQIRLFSRQQALEQLIGAQLCPRLGLDGVKFHQQLEASAEALQSLVQEGLLETPPESAPSSEESKKGPA